jgi:hypothetical protein
MAGFKCGFYRANLPLVTSFSQQNHQPRAGWPVLAGYWLAKVPAR